MIIRPDGRLVVLTPTKTGTRSLEAALSEQGWAVVMPRHGRVLPDAVLLKPRATIRVFITIRNPYARLLSAYTYGRAQGYSGWFLGKAEGSFLTFLRAWARDVDERLLRLRHHDWLTPQADYYLSAMDYTENVKLLKLEDGGTRGMLEAIRKHDRKVRPVEEHRNRSKSMEGKAWEEVWEIKHLDAVGSRLDRDLDLGGYGYPLPAGLGRKRP